MNLLSIVFTSLILTIGCGNAPQASEQKAVSSDQAFFYSGVSDNNKGMRSGTIELKGSIKAPSIKKMYLSQMYGKSSTKIDSVAVVNGVFSFSKKELNQGCYMLSAGENNSMVIILNPTEPVVELAFNSGRLDMGMSSVNSKENEGWFTYLPQETALLKAIKDLRVQAAKSSLKSEFDKQIAAKELELLNLQKQSIEKYPDTHFAKLLTWKQEPTKTEIGKYWDNIDFSDQSIIHSTVLTDRIQNFMRGFSKGEESGFLNCVAMVADKAKADDKVLEFALNQMLMGFYESGMENICTYIIDTYINGDGCGDADLSNVIKSTAESIQKLSIGNVPPNIQMTTLDGASFDLMKTAASKKFTLVMFWSSWCEHCKGEAPEVKACYDTFKAKGFEIVGVSVDNNRNAWETAVKERGFSFPNVCGMKQWESKVAKDYRVTKTPVFYLLDPSGKIVLKPKGIREVQAYLNQNLK